jgi:hypothetical protein
LRYEVGLRGRRCKARLQTQLGDNADIEEKRSHRTSREDIKKEEINLD